MKKTQSIQAIADALGLSKATVSKALNGYPQVKEETRQRVQAYARQMGYQPPVGSKQPAQRRVAVIVEDYELNSASNTNDYYGVIMAFKEYAATLGLEVLLLGTTQTEQQHMSYDEMIREKQLDGALVMGLRLDDPYYAQIAETTVPTVLWDISYDNPKVACVHVDSVRGADMAVSHLLSLGHRRIGFLNGHAQAQVSHDRLNGYLLALCRAGLIRNDAYILHGNFREESGGRAADYFTQTDVTAIFCASDLMALGLLKRLAALGLRVPEDYAVVGYDNNIVAQLSTPSLTTIHQSLGEIGEAAGALLGCVLGGVPIRNVVLQPSLVIRQSSGGNIEP